jgi:hypothetical protein
MKKSKPSFSAQVRSELAESPVWEDFKEKREFVRECFITGGTISDPNRSHHLDFRLDATKANKLMQILQGFGLNPKQTTRRNSIVVYVKDAGEIADILNIMMAHKALLIFESICVEKDLRNNLNRKINFETANLNKTVEAALGQIEAIEYIAEHTGLGELSKPLEDVAKLRLANEDASLEEIGAMLDPPIGKSGVNHRLRKICEIAKELAAQA